MEPTAASISATVVISLNFVVIVPVIIYFLHYFRKVFVVKNESILKHRSLTVVYLMNALIIFALVGERGYAFYVIFIQAQTQTIPTWSVSLLFNLTWIGILCLFACKVYHLYFHQKFNLAVSDLAWRKDINPNDDNWYLKHKETFGEITWLLKFAFFPYAVIMALQSVCVWRIEHGIFLSVLYFVMASIPLSIVIYISWNIRGIEDIFYNKQEVVYQSVAVILSIAAEFVFVAVSHIICLADTICESKAHAVDDGFQWSMHTILLQVLGLALTLFNTAYPLHLHNKQLRNNSMSNLVAPTFDEKKNLRQKMLDIIAEYTSFKAYMQYLVMEFSTENLLFLSELIQIKYAFQVRNNNILRVPKKAIIQSGVDPLAMFKALMKDKSRPPSPKTKPSHKPGLSADLVVNDDARMADMLESIQSNHNDAAPSHTMDDNMTMYTDVTIDLGNFEAGDGTVLVQAPSLPHGQAGQPTTNKAASVPASAFSATLQVIDQEIEDTECVPVPEANRQVSIDSIRVPRVDKQISFESYLDSEVADLPALCNDIVSDMDDDDRFMVIDFTVEYQQFQRNRHRRAITDVFSKYAPSLPSFASKSMEAQKTVGTESRSAEFDTDALGYYFTYLFDEQGCIRCKLVVPSELPRSLILDENEENLHNQVLQLYNKYIKPGSKHELNISGEIRRSLQKFFESSQVHKLPKYKNYKLFNILDQCGFEILVLMQDSMNRFVSSMLYKKLLQHKAATTNRAVSKSRSNENTMATSPASPQSPQSPSRPQTPSLTSQNVEQFSPIIYKASSYKRLLILHGISEAE